MDSFILTLDNHFIYSIIIQLISTVVILGILCSIIFLLRYLFITIKKNKLNQCISLNDINEKLKDIDNLKMQYEDKLKELEQEKNAILKNYRAQDK